MITILMAKNVDEIDFVLLYIRKYKYEGVVNGNQNLFRFMLQYT